MIHSYTTETPAGRLRRALEEKLFWHGVSLLWAHTERALGCKEKRRQVQSFGFDPNFPDLDEAPLEPQPLSRPIPTSLTHHNFVRLQDQTVIPIPPFPRPVLPEWMRVDMQVKV